MKVGVFAQARLGSKRLPKKMLMEIDGKPLIEYCLQAASTIKADYFYLLVPQSEYEIFHPIASRNFWNILGGSENDVLSRFVDAIKITGCDVVVRVTGDKIISASSYVNKAIEQLEDYDLITYEENPLLSTTHCIIKSEILLKAYNEVFDKECREHVKPCVKCLGGKHKILPVPNNLLKFKYNFTIDTTQDFIRIYNMFIDLNKNTIISFEEALEWMKKNITIE